MRPRSPSEPAETERPEVLSSWARSARAVNRDIAAAPIVDGQDVTRHFLDSPLGWASRVIFDDLTDLAGDGDLIAAITDSSVTIDWVAGGRAMRRRAERVNFTTGACWAEAAVGTNALALARDRAEASFVLSSEHFAPMVQEWVCYSAPVHDPTTGRVLGVLDLSTVWNHAHPAMLTTASALARCVENELAVHFGDPHPGPDRRLGEPLEGADGGGVLTIAALGRVACRIDTVPVPVSRRQMELLSVLALHPDGLSLDELTGRVYGDHAVSPSTVKAELSHLRHALHGRITSRPYRLLGLVDSDVQRLLDYLAAGDLATAVDLYRGPLLPFSSSPEIDMWRNHIEVTLRTAVLSSGDGRLIRALSEQSTYDVELQQAAIASLVAHR